MKKALSSILAFALFLNFAAAQEAGKMAKSASKALAAYFVDTKGNADKLKEAKQKIDEAAAQSDAATTHSVWQTRGEIYGAIVQGDLVMRQINPSAPMSGENDALIAVQAFKKAYELGDKKFHKTDAIKGITDNNLQAALINVAADKFTAKEYDKAYQSFWAAYEAHQLLKENKAPSLMDDKANYENYIYYAGLSASNAGKHKEALDALDVLYKSGEAKAEVFDAMYQAKLAIKDEAGAAAILAEGRKKFPDDAGLLFAEINAYLSAGKLNELTDRLKQAIAKEPTNIGLYVTLGSVYDNLYQKALETKDETAAKTNFDEAMNYYQKALGIDAKNVDAIYSTGALYYNKAAVVSKRILEMPEDYSAAGIKKYEAMKNEMMGLFEQALPYFQKAESINPNDLNTLIALKEILTRKEDDAALEFKSRLDKVQAGGKNETSYFKN